MSKKQDWEILKEIYFKVGIEKPDFYFQQEINGWNRKYLNLLNSEIDFYLGEGENVVENLKFLLENPHNLKSVLLDPHLENKYSKYNSEFREILHCIDGFDVNNWFFWDTPVEIKVPYNLSKFKIKFTRCHNSFSTDYAIGNYSQNCFQIGGSEKKEYRKFLFEYFLDTSIQIFYISLIDSKGNEIIIGELNFTLKEDENNKLYLVITSLELQGEYENIDKVDILLTIFSFLNIFSKKVSNENLDFIIFRINDLITHVLDFLSKEVLTTINKISDSKNIDIGKREEYKRYFTLIKNSIIQVKRYYNLDSRKTRKLFFYNDENMFSGTQYYDLYSKKKRITFGRSQRFYGSIIDVRIYNQVNGYFFPKDFDFLKIYGEIMQIREKL